MMMGSAATFIDCDEAWKLLLVTRKGSLYVWDLFNKNCLLHDSLSSLFTSDLTSSAKSAGTIKVISAKLSESGSPLVVLATRHAFLFDISLRCWLRVADDCFPASNFASSLSLGSMQSGELGGLQVDVSKYLARKPGWSRVTDDEVQTRAHLEAQLASSLSLKSPNEYCQCLLSYIRFLAREADESRLREVCESFLGPPTGMAENTMSISKDQAWDPCVLGMRKHKLLREDILPAMATNRKVQRLLNEFMDILSEYDTAEPNLDQKNLSVPTPTPHQTPNITESLAAAPATDEMQLDPPNSIERVPVQTESLSPAVNADQNNSVPSAADNKDSPPVEEDKENSSHRPAAEQPMLSTAQINSPPLAMEQQTSEISVAPDQEVVTALTLDE